MRTKTIFRLTAIVMLLVMLATGCSSGNYVKIPYKHSEVSGKNADTVLADFKAAGFTNITEKTKETTWENSVGTVESLTIDGKRYYTDTSAKKDVEIILTRYELKEKEPTATPTEEPKAEKKEYTASVDSVKEMCGDLFDFEYDSLEVSYDAEIDEAYVVSYRITDCLDVTTFVRQNINRYILFCQTAYSVPGIDRVRFDIQLLGQDQYGQDYTITAIQEIMTKETFAKFNWANLEYQNIWEVFNDECYYFGIAPEIINSVDTESVFYDPFTADGKIR